MPGSSEFKRYQDMVGLNGKQFDSGERSQGDQEAQQRMMQNMMTAHHLDPNAPAGDIPFTEPSLEDLVEMVRQGKIGKEVLGPDADIMLQYGTPSQREKQLKDTGSLEIPVVPNVRDTREGPDEDDLAFLKDFINKKMG
tara:strand:- start:1044 stop:1460 length:417 start_codon:yes stop_codon:yes gene_type:complete